MAYETKAILSLLAHTVSKAESVEEAYDAILAAANVEGFDLPPYKEMIKKTKKKTTKKE